MEGAADPYCCFVLHNTTHGPQPFIVEVSNIIVTIRLVPLAFVDAHLFSRLNRYPSIGKEIWRVCKNHVKAFGRHCRHNLLAIAFIENEVACIRCKVWELLLSHMNSESIIPSSSSLILYSVGSTSNVSRRLFRALFQAAPSVNQTNLKFGIVLASKASIL